MKRSVRLGASVIGVVLFASTAAACAGGGDTTGAGGTSATSAAPPPPAIVSPDRLDAGPYPKVPRPPLGQAGDPGLGATVDAQQMAAYVVGPWAVDDTLITPYLRTFYVINAPSVLQQLGPEEIAKAAGEQHLIDGFASAREVTDKASMVNAVLRFPDPASATAASTAMADASAKRAVQGITPTVTAIPGHPQTLASTYPFTARATNQTRSTIRAFTAHGPYVFMQFVQTSDGVDAAATLVAKTVDAQGPLIDQFKAADPNALANVPLDPTGLMAKTIPTTTDTGPANNAVYPPRGAQHFQSNPIASAKLFEANGVTEVAIGLTNVYQTKDATAAKSVTEAFNAEVSTDGTTAAAGVPGLPDSHCLAYPKQFYCVAPAGEYAIEVRGAKLVDVQQQVAAQYIMLTAK